MRNPTITPEEQNRKAREAYRLANDIHLDLITGSRVYALLQKILSVQPASKKPSLEVVEIGFRRMCLWHVILTLSKWVEYYDNYKPFIPAEAMIHAKNLRNEIVRRGIRDFRNNTVGHVWDDKMKRPITREDTESRIQKILGTSDPNDFMLWVNNPTNNQFPRNVVMVIEQVREQIQTTNHFSKADLI